MLAQVLQDVLAFPQVRMGMPVVLACDGGPDAAQYENAAIAIRAKIPGLHLLMRPEHYGIGRNVYEAKRYLFEECKFDRVFYVEDDIRMSPHLMTLLQNMMAWIKANYSNECVVSTAVFCNMPLEEKQASLGLVSDCGYSLCNHMMSRECWILTRPWMQEYVQRFLQCPYKDRDIARIGDWMRGIAERLPVHCGNRPFPVHWPAKEYFTSRPVSSQDGAMALALRLAGFSHAVALVNRAWHVGQTGENTTEESWQRSYSQTKLDIFEEDNTRTHFRIMA
jgi:hypothetical protein